MKDFVDVFERPMKFFKQEKSFKLAFAHFVFAMVVVVSLDEVMIYLGFAGVERQITGLPAVAVNLVSAVAGYFVVTALSFLPLAAMGKKNYRDFFVVTAYSLTPLMFFWIPHVLPQAVVVVWSVMLMIVGTSQKMKVGYKKTLPPVFVFVALVVLMSLIFNNYIFVPLNEL